MFIHGRAQGYSERALTADPKSLGDFRSGPRFCDNLVYICFGLDATCPLTLRYLVSEANCNVNCCACLFLRSQTMLDLRDAITCCTVQAVGSMLSSADQT